MAPRTENGTMGLAEGLAAVVCLLIAIGGLRRLFAFVRLYVLAQFFSLRHDLASLGGWAVVTGSTDGIGKEFARAFARSGFNVVLIARSEKKLANVSCALQREFDVAVKCIVFDFAKSTDYSQLKEELSHLDISILINNVGTALMHPEYFDAMHEKENLQAMINVNVIAAVEMTGALLHKMKERGKGVVVTIGSGASNHPTPLLSLYTGTKAFLDLFTQSLHDECSPHGVHCQVLAPYFISTNMSNISPRLFVPSAEDYVMQAYNTLGLTRRTSGHWSHEIQSLFYEILPWFVIDWTAIVLLRRMREDGLRAANTNGHVKRE